MHPIKVPPNETIAWLISDIIIAIACAAENAAAYTIQPASLLPNPDEKNFLGKEVLREKN